MPRSRTPGRRFGALLVALAVASIASNVHAAGPGAAEPGGGGSIGLYVVGALAVVALLAAFVTSHIAPVERRGPRPDRVESTAVLIVGLERPVGTATSGQGAGSDAVFASVQALVDRSVRDGDVVYRSGEAEICVLLADADPSQTSEIALRIMANAGDIVHADGSPVRLNIGQANGTSATLDATVKAADRSLWAIRHAGVA